MSERYCKISFKSKGITNRQAERIKSIKKARSSESPKVISNDVERDALPELKLGSQWELNLSNAISVDSDAFRRHKSADLMVLLVARWKRRKAELRNHLLMSDSGLEGPSWINLLVLRCWVIKLSQETAISTRFGETQLQ